MAPNNGASQRPETARAGNLHRWGASGEADRAKSTPSMPSKPKDKGARKKVPTSLPRDQASNCAPPARRGASAGRLSIWPCRLRLSTILLGLLRFNAEASMGDYCQRLVLKQTSCFPQRMSSVFYDPFRPKMHACSGSQAGMPVLSRSRGRQGRFGIRMRSSPKRAKQSRT